MSQTKGSLHFWIVAGMVSGASRFLPIPFVDDLVRDQCRRLVVSRTLAEHDTNLKTKELQPYYADDGGCLTGCMAIAAKLPLKLLLFPIRKAIAIVTSVRGVPLEIVRMVLLGRTLDRCLREDRISTDYSAKKMRAAFEEAFAKIDFRVIRAGLNDVMSRTVGWKTSATKSARKLAEVGQPEADVLSTSDEVDRGATEIEAVLQRPEMLSIFADFDQRFDAAMRHRSVSRKS
jgi:hypothetical protein